MTDLIEIINGISQVMAQTFDGATDKDGVPMKAGLRREEVPALNSRECRLLDGFKARVTHHVDKDDSFPCLILSYHSELKLEEAHDSKLTETVEEHISQALQYLKKEFKKVSKKELNVEKHGDIKILVEETSRIRVFVTAQCHYKIKGVNIPKVESRDAEHAKQLEKWLSLGGLKR